MLQSNSICLINLYIPFFHVGTASMTKLHGCITTSTTKITNPTFFSTNQINLQNINHIKLKNLHFLDSKASSKYPSSASFLTNFYSPFCTSSISQTPQIQFNMSQGKDESGKLAYDAAMEALSSLITKRTRADKSNTGDRFDILFDYLKMLELEASIGKLKVIHVAGTKGKGSTCAFSESILRNCGLRTGLFTSPHLIDVRERFRLDGKDISEEKFLEYFWWCFNRLKDESSDDLPMPTYFRFLALLAFKIFVAEQVDVAILEVGLGGMYDATNVVEAPAVCGIASLGYDHMEILGNTLGQIAGEKAGIFKRGVPAFTVPQPGEAMRVLEEKASKLDVNLQVVAPLDPNLLNGLHLGLDGEHQYVNAGLAVSLCSAFLQRTGHVETSYSNKKVLPEKFVKGLNSVAFQGRAQIVRDEFMDERQGDLVFYLDGAHSPESMDVCANWFSRAIKEGYDHRCTLNNQSQTLQESDQDHHHDPLNKKSEQILLFNCMSVRDPQLLLPHLMSTCANQGVYFKKALFVPNISLYYKVGTATEPAKEAQVDISWQLTLQKVWENLIRDGKAKDQKLVDVKSEEIAIDAEKGIHNAENSSVFSSLPLAINWLRDNARRNQSTRVQVLVSGSLHLVGDVLRLVKK